MGVSKKKLAKQTKMTNAETVIAIEETNTAKRNAARAADAASKLSFSENVNKTNLK